MSVNIDTRLGEAPVSQEQAYKPYFSMRDELIGQQQVPARSMSEVILSLRSGIMPDMGAVVSLGHGACAGFDLVNLERVSEKEAVTSPAPKSAVDDETDRIMSMGGITYTDDYGNMKIFGLIRQYNGFNDMAKNVIRLSDSLVLEIPGMNLPQYKIIEEDSGLLVARAPIGYK